MHTQSQIHVLCWYVSNTYTNRVLSLSQVLPFIAEHHKLPLKWTGTLHSISRADDLTGLNVTQNTHSLPHAPHVPNGLQGCSPAFSGAKNGNCLVGSDWTSARQAPTGTSPASPAVLFPFPPTPSKASPKRTPSTRDECFHHQATKQKGNGEDRSFEPW